MTVLCEQPVHMKLYQVRILKSVDGVVGPNLFEIFHGGYSTVKTFPPDLVERKDGVKQ